MDAVFRDFKKNNNLYFKTPGRPYLKMIIHFVNCRLVSNIDCIIMQVLTGVRIGLQLLLAFMAALVYENIGNNSSQVLNNIGLMLFSQVVYGILGLLTTVMACKNELE